MAAFVQRVASVTACSATEACPDWWKRREATWRREVVAAEHLRLCTQALAQAVDVVARKKFVHVGKH